MTHPDPDQSRRPLRIQHAFPVRAVLLGMVLALSACASISALIPAHAYASVRPEDRERISRPLLLAPAPGARLVESQVTFAFEKPAGSTRAMLVISRRAFDPSGWTELPVGADMVLCDASGPVLSLVQAGVKVDAETPLWWALAVRDGDTGRLRVSEVWSFTALPRFRNRVAPSPYLPPARLDQVRGPMAGAGEASGRPRIRLSAGYDFDPLAGEPAVPADLSSAAQAPEGEGAGAAIGACLVQFASAPGAAERATIARSGGAVVSYIPDHAYLVRLSGEARARLAKEPGVTWVGDYQPAYKLSALVDRTQPGEAEYTALVFADANLDAAAADIAARGGTITARSSNGINQLLRFRAPGAALAAIAGLAHVAWVEPVVPLTTDNDNAQWVVQTNVNGSRRVWDMGIRGQGQVVNTTDSGINVLHEQFKDPALSLPNFGDYPTHRKVIAYKPGSTNPAIEFGDHGTTYHGTHTAGTIAGSDDPTINLSPRDGMAKDAKIYFMDISGSSLGTGVDPFPDLNDLYLPPYLGNAGGAARVSSNSWGANVAGQYTLNAQQVDQFMWSHPDFFIAFSNGNAGTAGSVGSPATAKNCASIGGTQNGTLTGIYSSTSRGPTQDGRRKPTICSPGQTVYSANGASTAAYIALSGTSMASPSTSGAVALIRQYLADGWYPTGAPVLANGFSPSAALLKAMAINSADNSVTGFTAPDNNVGWGKIKIDNVLYFPGDARKLLLVDNTEGLGGGQAIEYQVNVVDGSTPLEVSLVWTDYPGNPAAAIQLVNDLNLTVSVGATAYKGNVYSAGASVTGGVYDTRNVEECVLVNSPPTGVWTVRVDAPTVPMGPQPFALVVTGGVGNGAGALALDRAEYGSGSTVELQVIDTNAGPTVNVGVHSTSEPTAEVVTLTGGDGVFTGTIQLSPVTSTAGDGTLTVSNGDVIVATYDDASPVASVSATATVNFDAPLITNVKATSMGVAGTSITWTTDRGGNSRVYYGLTQALELGSVNVPGAVTAHQVLLSDLVPGATYFYDVESVSLSGGLARDSLGGAHYRVTAKGQGDILLLYGEPGFERAFAWENALTANGYDYDIWSGPIADTAPLGDLTRGLRSYKAVIWQPGFEQYPPFSDLQRDSITAYLGGGGRLAISGHDIGWALADPSSPSYSPTRALWLQNTLKAQFLADPATWSRDSGYAADPISGSYTGPSAVTYTPFRSGGAGDEVSIVANPGGTTAYVWKNNDASADNVGFRWESATTVGDPGLAFWGGQTSRLVNMFFEFTAMAPPFGSPSAIRNDILDKTVTWLLGRQRPLVGITVPNGGETVTTGSVDIAWTESAGSGLNVASRALEYSLDGGSSWSPIASGVGPSPYSWDLSSVPNSASARVRIRITDDGVPALGAGDASNADFRIDRAGGDTQGPVVVAGSIEVSPNPIIRPNPATLTARVSDQYTGAGTVDAAEWSVGPAPAPAGTGTVMGGSFGTTTVDVSAVLSTGPFLDGVQKLWVRAHDAAGNWGAAAALDVQMNGTGTTGVTDALPSAAFLSQNVPNPFAAGTSIRFGLPARGQVELTVYDVQGRLVRRLVARTLEPGTHMASWDGRDEQGARVAPGIYYYRLVADGKRLDRRLAVLE